MRLKLLSTLFLLLVFGPISLSGCMSQGQDNGASSSPLAELWGGTGCLSRTASLVGLSDTSVSVTGNGSIQGNVVLLGNSTLTDSGNAAVTGHVYTRSASNVNLNGHGTTGSIIEEDLTVHEPDVITFMQSLGSEPATMPYTPGSIVSQGPSNVVRIQGDMHLSGHGGLVITGAAGDRFIIQVTGSVQVTGQADISLQGGVQPQDVLFILGGSLSVSGQGSIVGTFFMGSGEATLSGNGVINGSVFARGSIHVSGNGVDIEPAPFCPGPGPSPSPTTTPSPDPSPSGSPSPDPTPSGSPTPDPTPTGCVGDICYGGVLGV